MRDLYRALGLSPRSSTEVLAELIELCPDASLAATAKDILLDPSKRKAYDHAYYSRMRIAAARLQLNLVNTVHWSEAQQIEWSATYRAVVSARTTPPSDEKQKKRKLAELLLILGVAGFTVLLLIQSNCSSNKAVPPTSTSYTESPPPAPSATTDINPPSVLSDQDAPVFPDPDVLPRPSHGRMFVKRGEGIGRLTIKNGEGQDHYIKLVDAESRRVVRSFYMRSGKDLTIRVPLGRYRVMVNSGQDWYGAKRGFGAYSSRTAIDEIFDFYIDGDKVSGYTFTMYTVKDGNLRTSTLSAEDFDSVE